MGRASKPHEHAWCGTQRPVKHGGNTQAAWGGQCGLSRLAGRWLPCGTAHARSTKHVVLAKPSVLLTGAHHPSGPAELPVRATREAGCNRASKLSTTKKLAITKAGCQPRPPESTTWPRTMRTSSGTLPEKGARNGGRLLPASCGGWACQQLGREVLARWRADSATLCHLAGRFFSRRPSKPSHPPAHLSSKGDGQRQLAEQLLNLCCAPHFHRRQAILAHRRLRQRAEARAYEHLGL